MSSDPQKLQCHCFRMKIKKDTLEFILGVSKKFHPNEFGGLLRGKNDIIEEVLIIPASTFGKKFVTTRFDMIPIDYSIIGSVHSHPGHRFKPSNADIRFFKKTGSVHLIVRYPYRGIEDVAAYDRDGKKIDLEVLDKKH
ncbi:MAG: metalloprotease [Candidatus Altiarchaeales archaeon]|nr:MAG: metalloprotease [Candidatus Altiarchaeales archaeon]